LGYVLEIKGCWRIEVSPSYQPRIEVYEHGRNVPVAPHPPVLSSAFLGKDVILEKYLTPQAAQYGERESTTDTLFMYVGEPARIAWRGGGPPFNAWVHPGRLWFVPRSMPYTSSFQGPHGGVVLSLGKSHLERQIGPLMRGGRTELAPGFNLEDGPLEHLVRAILAMAQDGSGADALMGELLVNAACIRLAKRLAASKLNMVPCRGGLPAARLKRVLEYIDANLGKNITLSELAGAVNMSLYYFAVLFRRSTGLSPHRYVLNQRVERAKELLRDPELSVLDVSIDVGFEHQNNFARAFRRVIGVSPTQFRRDRL
jgi:AraC family transcriptional regulator